MVTETSQWRPLETHDLKEVNRAARRRLVNVIKLEDPCRQKTVTDLRRMIFFCADTKRLASPKIFHPRDKYKDSVSPHIIKVSPLLGTLYASTSGARLSSCRMAPEEKGGDAWELSISNFFDRKMPHKVG